MSSSLEQNTRVRILDAALALVQSRVSHASMGRIAKEAGVSRQAVYLHFRDRGDLYVALVQHFDAQRGLASALEAVFSAPTAEAGIMEAVAMEARMNPDLYPVAAALDGLRHQDDAVQQAWQDRLDDRLKGARAMIDRLAAEGRLRDGLDPATAADLLWTMLSLRMWTDLVLGRGWSAQHYRDYVSHALRRTLMTDTASRDV